MRSEMLNDLSLISGVRIKVVDENGTDRFVSAHFQEGQEAIDYLTTIQDCRQESEDVLQSAFEYAIKFGGNYIFNSPTGLTFSIASIVRDNFTRWFVVGGPIIMMNFDDYYDFEVLPHVPEGKQDEVLSMLKDIPVLDPLYVSAFAAQLHMNAEFISSSFIMRMPLSSGLSYGRTDDRAYQSSHFDGIRNDAHWDPSQYTIRRNLFSSRKLADSHQQLISNLSTKNAYQARLLMDSILEQTLYHTSSGVDFIKAKIPEYLVVLFENAISSGSDAATIENLEEEVLANLHTLQDLDEIVKWLNEVIERFEKCLLTNPSSKHAPVVLKAMEYIREHAAEKITLNEVAKHVYLSPTYFSKLLKSETGQSFTSYLNRIRIEQSKQLMTDFSKSIAEISNQVGYDDQSYFTKVFKKHEGVTPYRYRCEIEVFN